MTAWPDVTSLLEISVSSEKGSSDWLTNASLLALALACFSAERSEPGKKHVEAYSTSNQQHLFLHKLVSVGIVQCWQMSTQDFQKSDVPQAVLVIYSICCQGAAW